VKTVPFLVVVACGGEPAPAARIVSAEEIGLVDQSPLIQGRDGGESARVFGRVIFAYGDTVTNVPDADGQTWHHNSWSYTDDDTAADGLGPLVERVDASGAPSYLIAPTTEEEAFNAAHRGDPCPEEPCGARFAVWPSAPLWDEARGRALILYGLIYAEPGAFNFHGVGTGIAVWNDFDEAPERPVVSPGAEHPTLLWAEGEPSPDNAAVIDGDTLHAFQCREETWSRPCTLWSAPLDRVLEREAWRVWDGAAWDGDPGRAADLFDGAPIMSVAYNQHLGAWVAIYAETLENEIVLRTAPALTGPWSGELHVIDTDPGASDSWTYDALAHPSFDEDGGRVIYVTYSRPTGETWFSARFPLIRVELARAD
jgi:hypothetical protein